MSEPCGKPVVEASRRVLFLDIDGVLNGHRYDERAQSSTLDKGPVDALNRVIDATDCRIVLSSAWRYMILGRAMTLRGFDYMLRTHGVWSADRLLSLTVADEDIQGRGNQIREWLSGRPEIATWAVVDDMICSSMEWLESRFVRTDPDKGLTDSDADRLIALLGSQ